MTKQLSEKNKSILGPGYPYIIVINNRGVGYEDNRGVGYEARRNVESGVIVES